MVKEKPRRPQKWLSGGEEAWSQGRGYRGRRPPTGAYAQLQQLLEDSPVEVYGEPDEKDAATIVRNGIKAVGTADVLIIDTAGRDSLDDELRDELVRIAEIANATEDSCDEPQVGQAAGPVAQTFQIWLV